MYHFDLMKNFLGYADFFPLDLNLNIEINYLCYYEVLYVRFEKNYFYEYENYYFEIEFD
jgi:hypothetical protein